MTAVKDDPSHQRPDDLPDHVLAVLDQALDGFRRDLMAARMPAAARGLRTSQLRLLALTPVDGMRVTDLAERVGMTKQALGEFANDLEDRGYLESVRDPADRRVRIVRPTRRGLAAVAASQRVIDEIEGRWRERLGAADWDRMKALLRRAVAAAAAARAG